MVGVLAPGVALVRACRPRTVALVEDLSWGAAAGLLVALAGWLADRLLPWPPGPLVWGLLVVAVLLLPPRVPQAGARRADPGVGSLVGPPPDRSAAGGPGVDVLDRPRRAAPAARARRHDVHPRLLFQQAMTGELAHALRPTYPMVAGEPLSYHWFVYAIQAHLLGERGLPTADVVLRLVPSALLPALLALGATVARRLSGRVAAGPVAALLLAVVGSSLPTRWVVPNGIPTRWNADGGSLEALTVYWQDSPPQALAWVAGVAGLGLTVAVIRRASDDAAMPVRLLAPFLVLCAGARSSQLPVLLGGVAVALVAMAWQRQWARARRAGVVLVLGVAVGVGAVATLYAAGGYGLVVRPGGRLALVLGQLMPGLLRRTAPGVLAPLEAPGVALLAAAVVYLLPLVPRLVGLPLALWHRPRDPAGWVALGTLATGAAATFTFLHPASSEVSFLVSAYPLALVGSAAGLVVGLEGAWRAAVGRRRRAGPVLALAAVAGLGWAHIVATSYPLASPLARWRQELGRAPDAGDVGVAGQVQAWLAPQVLLWGGVAVILLISALVLVAAPRVLRRRPLPPAALPAVFVLVVLGTGLQGTWLHVHRGDGVGERQAADALTAQDVRDGVAVVTPELVAAGDWLRRHSAPADVVATNRYCTDPRDDAQDTARSCTALDFSVAALTGRRTDVAGWAYSASALAGAWRSPVASPAHRSVIRHVCRRSRRRSRTRRPRCWPTCTPTGACGGCSRTCGWGGWTGSSWTGSPSAASADGTCSSTSCRPPV